METKARSFPISLETTLAVVIAVASLSTALAAWRTSSVNSAASNANREGLIQAIQAAAVQNESWRMVYQEAGYTRDAQVELAAIEVLEENGDTLSLEIASNMRQYLLANLQTLAGPMAAGDNYRQQNGMLDIQKRYDEVYTSSEDAEKYKPLMQFDMAALLHQEQRFLTVAVVFLAASLFWLGLAEISRGKTKLFSFAIGAFIFGSSLLYLILVEIAFALIRGGL